jgi:hypothetical protein
VRPAAARPPKAATPPGAAPPGAGEARSARGTPTSAAGSGYARVSIVFPPRRSAWTQGHCVSSASAGSGAAQRGGKVR